MEYGLGNCTPKPDLVMENLGCESTRKIEGELQWGSSSGRSVHGDTFRRSHRKHSPNDQGGDFSKEKSRTTTAVRHRNQTCRCTFAPVFFPTRPSIFSIFSGISPVFFLRFFLNENHVLIRISF